MILLASLALGAASSGIAGSWKESVVGGVFHKSFAKASFEFKTDGDRLTGMAHIGRGWPGIAPVTEGKINGDHVTFTVVGEHPSSNGIPIMTSDGVIHGSDIELSMKLTDGNLDTGTSQLKGSRASE